ncbi:hypothetical protein GCM10009737_20430 [Nocardioides lentus]|uniref:Uncharacterized protein n=1 Tax=Nocardioides lentus TaxID=338077 RepID=A0ABN2PFE3_9ACTN
MPVLPLILSRAAAVCAAGAAVLAVTSVPAHAESVGVDDPVGDVVNGRFRAGVPADDFNEENTDIRRTVLDHRRSVVVTRLRMVDVEASVVPQVTVRLRTPSGATFSARMAPGTDVRKVVTLTKDVADGEEAARVCDGLRGSLLPEADELVVAVPRPCLANPRTIRFGALVRNPIPQTSVNSYDDARLTGGVNPIDYETPIGRREVRRG